MEMRQAACDKLLLHRVDSKMRGKKVSGIMNRLRVATPVRRDQKVRLRFDPVPRVLPSAPQPVPDMWGEDVR